MATLYMDNFRGFTKTFIPLKDINFFVGENSTGKTSVLKLIKIISEPGFWLTQNFNIENAELGYFSEMISVNSNNKKYFEIGILDDKNEIYGIKMRFFENEGKPELRHINIINANLEIEGFITESGIKYRYLERNLNKKNNKFSLVDFYKHWIEENNLKNKRYKEIKIKDPFLKTPLLFQIDNIVMQKFSNQNDITNFKIPKFFHQIAWIAPIRTEPKRTYDNYQITFQPDGTHTPYLLKKLLEKNKKEIKNILVKFGKDSGLFTDITIKKLGKSQSSPFEIQISLDDRTLKITNVGYGVSQILPLIIEVIARKNNTWFAMQQPEIHLHPKAQAAFGDFIFKSFIKENKKFIIETHSDYIIDRLRIRLNKSKQKNINPESQIIFFNKTKNGNSVSIIEILNNGTISDNQPKEFREFFIKEQLELIKI